MNTLSQLIILGYLQIRNALAFVCFSHKVILSVLNSLWPNMIPVLEIQKDSKLARTLHLMQNCIHFFDWLFLKRISSAPHLYSLPISRCYEEKQTLLSLRCCQKYLKVSSELNCICSLFLKRKKKSDGNSIYNICLTSNLKSKNVSLEVFFFLCIQKEDQIAVYFTIREAFFFVFVIY